MRGPGPVIQQTLPAVPSWVLEAGVLDAREAGCGHEWLGEVCPGYQVSFSRVNRTL